jgi:putative transposase
VKGKSAIAITRTIMGKKRNFTGENFWARGYFVSTVGLDEEMVREYIRRQETENERLEQLRLNISLL